MKIITLMLLSLLSNVQIIGQDVDLKDPYNVLSSARKTVFAEKKEVFFNKEYIPAKMYTSKGLINASNRYKLDLELNAIYYLDNTTGEERELKNDVQQIEFLFPDGKMVAFERGFPVIEGFKQQQFYQVMVDGKAKLLMATKFEDITVNKYGSAPEKSLEKIVSYFVFSNGTIVKISKQEHFSIICSDKLKEVQDFIQKENLKLKKVSDIERVVKYYNSLFNN